MLIYSILLAQSVANQLLDDAETLYSEGSFSQHYFQFGGVMLKKPNVRRSITSALKIIYFSSNFLYIISTHCNTHQRYLN